MNALHEIIRGEIEPRGVISFARFMELCLYRPEFGYYERLTNRPGRRGDFYTNVSVGTLFGELLALQFAQWLRDCQDRRAECESHGTAARGMQILEAGAHNGQLAADILAWLRSRQPQVSDQLEYWILEPSPRRQRWQRETLDPLGAKVRWFGSWEEMPPGGVTGIIFSNELLDAMPVHRLGWDAETGTWFEWGVSWKAGRFVWQRLPLNSIQPSLTRPADHALSSGARGVGEEGDEQPFTVWMPRPITGRPEPKPQPAPRPNQHPTLGLPPLEQSRERLLSVLPDGFTTEVSTAAADWWRQAAATLTRGHLLTFDYGLSAEEFFRPERADGTLRAYHRHRRSEDVLADPGEQDLTAHVNFTALEAAGRSQGLQTGGLCPQAAFLTRIARMAWEPESSFGEWTSKRTRQFQTLTHPEHLGRQFKVLIQYRCPSRRGRGLTTRYVSATQRNKAA